MRKLYMAHTGKKYEVAVDAMLAEKHGGEETVMLEWFNAIMLDECYVSDNGHRMIMLPDYKFAVNELPFFTGKRIGDLVTKLYKEKVIEFVESKYALWIRFNAETEMEFYRALTRLKKWIVL